MLRVGSGQVASRVFLISWVGSDRVSKDADVADRIGLGWVGSGRVGSGQGSLDRVRWFSESHESGRVALTRPDPTREA